MVLKLYAHTVSPPSTLVLAVLHEKNIPFEFVTVELFKGQHKSPEFLTENPFGQVPCIVSKKAFEALPNSIPS